MTRRPLLKPLVPLYRAAQLAEDWLRTRGMPQTRTLAWPVISVGSLSAGGAGKTPVVIALAELLCEAGWHVDVLSRGYGRTGRGVARVEVSAENAAAKFGDEPVLIAQRTGVPVWVGAERYAAGRAAEAANDTPHTNSRVHLLDDGFQHRKLARAFEVVLVTAEDLDDTLLPAGNLREPHAALARADAVVVRQDEVDRVAKRVWPLLREGAQLWTVRRALRFPEPLGVLAAGLRPLAFCAIARPEDFSLALRHAGCGIVDTVVLPDHAAYSPSRMQEIVAFAHKLKATGLVTTEKDAVKLSAAARAQLESAVGPLAIVALDTNFDEPAAVLRALMARLESAR
jgi:tetraacyldisaccharide 4'-kinase